MGVFFGGTLQYSINYNTMKKNMGVADRVIRLAIAVVLSLLYFTNTVSGFWGVVMLVVAAVFVLTGFLGLCPLYLPFHINTNKKKTN